MNRYRGLRKNRSHDKPVDGCHTLRYLAGLITPELGFEIQPSHSSRDKSSHGALYTRHAPDFLFQSMLSSTGKPVDLCHTISGRPHHHPSWIMRFNFPSHDALYIIAAPQTSFTKKVWGGHTGRPVDRCQRPQRIPNISHQPTPSWVGRETLLSSRGRSQ